MPEYDVIVVGGGPAGSATAATLAKLGFSVLLLDKATFPRDKACAEYCSPGVEDALRRIGCWTEVAREAHRFEGMDLIVRDRTVLRVRYRDTTRRLAFTLPRLRLDDILIRHAESCGAMVMQGALANEIQAERSFVTVYARHRNGDEKTVTARAIVGADGLHSTVARWAERQHLPDRRRRTARLSAVRPPKRLGLVAHYEGLEGISATGEMHVGSSVYCGLAPLPNEAVNVGLVMPYGMAKGRSVSERFDYAVHQLPAVRDLLNSGRMSKPIRGIGPMSNHAPRIAGAGWLLVGDAAGFTDPFTGEGIYRALCSGEIAAGVIAESLQKGDTDEAPVDLSRYAGIRDRTLRGKERFTDLIQLALRRPAVLSVLCRNIGSDQNLAQTVGGILGDCVPARNILWPGNLAGLAGAAQLTRRASVT